jgi:nicotinamide/nicotinate riboside kinase
MIIGIGGLSRSGKTKLAERLCYVLRDLDFHVTLISQDHFTKKLSSLPKFNHYVDWEQPAGIDFKLLYNSLLWHKKRYDIVIVEGFLMFHDSSINQILDKKIKVEISQDCFKKRKAEDKRWSQIPEDYIEHIYQSFLKYGNYPCILKDEFMVSGEKEVDLATLIKKMDLKP